MNTIVSALLAFLTTLFRSRATLQLEIVALRRQITVYHRKTHRPWIKTTDYWDVYRDLTATVKQRFDSEGISLPFPKRDVHLFQVAEQAAS